jgi:hypothetical protein
MLVLNSPEVQASLSASLISIHRVYQCVLVSVVHSKLYQFA